MRDDCPAWFHYMGVFIVMGYKWLVYKGNPMKMDDLEVPLFQETSMYFPRSQELVPIYRSKGETCAKCKVCHNMFSDAFLALVQ